MKRLVIVLLLAVMGVQAVSPAFAARRRVVVHRHAHRRTTVVVHRGWPLRRPARVVVVRPVRRPVVVVPAVYLAPVVFAAAVVTLPARDVIVWEDSETISKDEDWTEFTLNVEDRGQRLFMEVVGRAQVDWAEVVFENGDTRVVDFKERTHGSGVYLLLDFKDGRKVDHVRLVARAKTDETTFILRMEK
jgi:hypothetical protein